MISSFTNGTSDPRAWNRLLPDTKLPTKILAAPDVKYFYHDAQVLEVLHAPLLHYCDCSDGERILAMQATFVSRFHADGDGTLIWLLER